MLFNAPLNLSSSAFARTAGSSSWQRNNPTVRPDVAYIGNTSLLLPEGLVQTAPAEGSAWRDAPPFPWRPVATPAPYRPWELPVAATGVRSIGTQTEISLRPFGPGALLSPLARVTPQVPPPATYWEQARGEPLNLVVAEASEHVAFSRPSPLQLLHVLCAAPSTHSSCGPAQPFRWPS